MPPTLVMLHGANGAGEEILPLADLLRPSVAVETPNLLGHGGRPLPECLTTREMADDMVTYLDERKIARAYLFGYSFGGYVALYLARHYPERVSGLCLLAVKYVFDDATVQRFTYLADPERLRRPGGLRPARLAKLHYPQDWAALTILNRNLFRELGPHPALVEADLRCIKQPALIISSEKDQLVPWPEAEALGQFLAGSQLVCFPGKAHPLLVCPLQGIADTMRTWLGRVETAWDSAWLGPAQP